MKNSSISWRNIVQKGTMFYGMGEVLLWVIPCIGVVLEIHKILKEAQTND